VSCARQDSDCPPVPIARFGGALGALLALALLLAASASANTYEQVATFAASGQSRQLFEATGMAVNVSGAGGVPSGSLYSATTNSVARYTANGEFREAWGWSVANSNEKEFQRCGPDGEASHPTCEAPRAGAACLSGEPGADQLCNTKGVAVDQTTGYVYVLSQGRVHGAIQVFSADGSELIASFGEHSTKTGFPGETFDEGPEKLHSERSSRSIAVDDAGVVYVDDFSNNIGRIMVFEPQSPGDYEHYVYAGRSHDIAEANNPESPVVDSAGNLYIAGKDAGKEAVLEFDLSEPAAPACRFLAKDGILALAVDPESGAVFYSGFKSEKNKLHQLSPCDALGELEQTSESATPRTITALAFDPALAWSPSRPSGVLYGAFTGEETPLRGLGYIYAPAEVHPPTIEAESVSAVTSTTAALHAQINPKGSPTRYAFQYLTEAQYEANEPGERFAGANESPLGGAALGTGQEALGAGSSLTGLQPDTAYRYRAVASSHCDPEHEEEACETAGAAQVFHTFPVEPPGLSDNRAWELVSPPQKNGGEVIPADSGVSSCGYECKPAANGVSSRFPLQSSPDGEAVVYEGFPFSFTEGAATFNEYAARRTASGWQTTILAPQLLAGTGIGSYKAFDTELTKGLIEQSRPTLSAEAPSEYDNLYAQPTASPAALSPLLLSQPPNRLDSSGGYGFALTYAGASADLSRIFFEANDALTPETPFAPEATDGGTTKNNLYEWHEGSLSLVSVLPGNVETIPGAAFGARQEGEYVKADLSHAISADGSRAFWSDEAGQVYVREEGETTREIPDPGKFLSASADGSRVLLQDGFLYDLETEEATDLSEGEGGFEGILGQSEDLSHIYFVDTAVLTGEEENEYGPKAQAGKDNLYAWDEGSVSFVATLDPSDATAGIDLATGDWVASSAYRTAEASPDGRWLAFSSRAPLSGYDNTGPCGVEGKLIPCEEAFLYDSQSGELLCPSCNRSGAHPLGDSTLRLIQGSDSSLPQPRYMLDNGRLYFDTQDSLTPFDTNEGVEDVYQYEPEGIGSCERESGCVNLISAGHEPIDSNLLAVDESGKNVFFTTRDQLVLKDRDDLLDLYDAREGGGIASETETSRGECQGEACQPAISPPNDPTPGSSSFEGAGNVVEGKQAKKHHRKKRHAKKKAHRNKHKRAAKHNRGGAK
jgi:DNA-binding beta-propeller fold protein YncE